MPLSTNIDNRKRQLNAIIVAAFNLGRDDVLSLEDSLGEEDDLTVLSLYEEHLPEINKARRGEALQRMHVWLEHRIRDAHTINVKPTLSKQDFRRLSDDVVVAAIQRGLMNYAKALHTTSSDRMDAELGRSEIYVRQMEEIELPDAVQIRGAKCFLVAAINRDGWMDDESIMEEDVEAFEEDLMAGYKQRKANVDITHANASQVEKGVALYNACMDPAFCRQLTINNRDPLDMTVEGSFHQLANAPEIGWHPDWESKFKNGCRDGTVA